MKLSDGVDSDNNNNADRKVVKRGRPRKIDSEALKASKDAKASVISDVDQDGSSPGIMKKNPSPVIRITPVSTKKRILKNRQSTLSPNYMGSPSPVLSDGGSFTRVTRNRSTIFDSSMEPVMTDDESTAATLIKGVVKESAVNGKNIEEPGDDVKETSLIRNNGFEADAEDADTQDNRLQKKRKQKRGRRMRKAALAEKVQSAAVLITNGVVEENVQQNDEKNETIKDDEKTDESALATRLAAENNELKKAAIELQDRLFKITSTESNNDFSEADATNDISRTQTESRQVEGNKVENKVSPDDSEISEIKTEPEKSSNERIDSQELNIEKSKSTVADETIKEEIEKVGNSNAEKSLTKIPINTTSKNIDASSSTLPVKSDPETSLNSPSAVSVDSAKGSSIVTDSNWPTYHPGDLYWGKLYTYCYWPCMVCPDPHGQLVGNAPAQPRRPADALFIQVHVRFFADNGRRNWVRHENLMPFAGLKAFEDQREDIRIKLGMKSPKFRQMLPKKNKVSIWNEAVNEANLVAELPMSERVEKFFEIYENSVSFQKPRKRRSSMLQAAGSTSDIGSSIYDSTDKLYAKQTLAVPKRERSESPYSPAFSPIKGANFIAKRRKVSDEDDVASDTANSKPMEHQEEDVDLNEVSNFITQQESGLYRNKEFMELFLALKEFVIRRDKNEQMERCLLSIANNIWSLLLLNMRQKESQRAQKPNDNDSGSADGLLGDKSVKRLSSRLKNINIRRSQTPVIMPTLTAVSKEPERRSSETSKPKKVLNRPINEVVEDILNLDRRYLFRGLGRDPVCKYCLQPGADLKRCSKGCNSWLHVSCSANKGPIEKAEKVQIETPVEKSDVELTETESNDSSASPSIADEPKSIVATIHVTAEGETHEEDSIMCNECVTNAPETCCICHQENVKNTSPTNSPLKSPFKTQFDSDKLVSCNMQLCTKKFHSLCCKYWPQAKISKTTVRCPSHVCHTCVSDDPSGKFQQLGNAKLTKCVKCPATYHMDSKCIPAGSKILTASHIICPRHTTTKSDMHVNVAWCYICVKGGELICCETCPIAVHAHCRNIPIKPNENYICEECESGRLPLYGEIVWAKFNNFRWWPAIILPPTEVPANIARMAHGPSDFVVRFFGTHDHGWISRRRVYLYIEGDDGEAPKTKSQLDQNYVNGVAEASRFLRIIKARRQEQSIAATNGTKLHPQPYIKIKTNKPVLPVKLHIDLEKVNKCECNPDAENPCGPDTECLNRVLFNECNPKVCRSGQRCLNQMFETRVSPRLEVVYMSKRGFGLICREPIMEGAFIIEYVGEIINDTEFRQRMAQKTRDRDENFYFLVVEKDYIIDAGPKGNLARFMNHSCDPNCETQKWSVNGINRIGLFAIKDIPENTELTFNYHWDDLLNSQKKACFCGAPKCAGEIGGKYKEDSPKEFLTQPSKTKTKSNASTKSKKFKELKRLQMKKKNAIKIDLLGKKSSTMKVKKHVSADDVIETDN